MPWHDSTDRPHPDYEKNFRAYRNYLTDIANSIGGNYGVGASLLDGVHSSVLAHPPLHRVQRRPVPETSQETFELGLRKGWGFLRRVQREVEDEAFYDEEANALMPYSAWYAVHHVRSRRTTSGFVRRCEASAGIRLRANVAALIEWLRIAHRQGWLGSARRHDGVEQRTFQSIGQKAAAKLARFRARVGITQPYGVPAVAVGLGESVPPSRRPRGTPIDQQVLDIE